MVCEPVCGMFLSTDGLITYLRGMCITDGLLPVCDVGVHHKLQLDGSFTRP
jgi:hypothetical protein